MLSLTLLALAGSLTAAPADTTYNKVTLPGTVEVAGQTLVLNGVALRKKAIFKVYVAGLYLPAKSNNPDAVLADDTNRELVMQFLRDVGKDKMCEAWDEALEKNTPDASEQLKAEFVTLCGYMEDIKKEQQFVFTYIAGTGTEIKVNGVLKGTIQGKDFADALFKAWIGPNPGPGTGFRDDLMGIKK
jgi:hypothetical protein